MFSGLFGSLMGLGGSLLGSGISAGVQVSENKKNREWQSNEAALNRNFQHQEAALARDFTENFYQQFQSPQALIRQGTAAGLHPYQALGLDPASGASSPMPQGSQANLPHQFDVGGTLSNGINNALAFLEQKSRIDLNNQLGKLYDSQRTGQDIENQYNPRLFQLNIQRGYVDIQNLFAGIRKFNSESNLNDERSLTEVVNREVSRRNADKILQETNNLIIDQATKRLQQEGIKINNVKLAEECKLIQLQQSLISLEKTLKSKYIDLAESEKNLTDRRADTEAQNTDSVKLDVLYKQWQNEYRAMWQMDPDSSGWNSIIQLFTGMFDKSRYLLYGF